MGLGHVTSMSHSYAVDMITLNPIGPPSPMQIVQFSIVLPLTRITKHTA